MKLFRRGDTYYVRWFQGGHEYKKSTHCRTEKMAQRVAAGLEREIILGRFDPVWERLTFEDLAEGIREHYQMNQRRSTRALNARLKHLTWFSGRRAPEITGDLVARYVKMRQQGEPSNSTINRELATLTTMFRLRGMPAPKVRKLKEASPRQGFVEWADFLRIRGELPERLRGLVSVLYVTAWRFGSVAHLQWRDVDSVSIRVRAEYSKNEQSLEFPINSIIREALDEARAHRTASPFVFHHNGQPYRDIRIAWKSACARAGFPTLLVHDLCRSGVRNLMRTPGITEHMAMGLAGRKTTAMLHRYNIITTEDKRLAVERLSRFLEEASTESKVAKLKR